MADDNVEKGEIESTKENFKHLIKKNRVKKFMRFLYYCFLEIILALV